MSKTSEILIYSAIGQTSFWDNNPKVSASSFAAEFKKAESESDIINIRINSPGGSISEGIAIYNMIAQSKKEVNTYIDGVAFSMAGIIAMAGKKVYAAKNSLLLIHNCLGMAMGNVRDLQNSIDLMNAVDESLATTVADKSGLTIAEVKAKWLDYNDHTLTAQQCIDNKLVDEIVDNNPSANVPANLTNLSKDQIIAFFYEGNDDKQASFLERIVATVREKLNPVTNQTQDIMNFEKLNAALDAANGADVVITSAQAAELKAEVTAALGKGNVITDADLQAAKDAATKAEAELVAANDAKAKAEADLVAEQEAFEAFKKTSPAAVAAGTADDDDQGADPKLSRADEFPTSIDNQAKNNNK
jgi:ATP-dependent Clp endopeptidase proteolytic subunit ClpP